GIITYVNDGEFDRETDGTLSKKLGNYIAIKHPNNYYSYYGHLRKNSIPVKVGETVTQGQTIGQVGSSGNSTDPHLHFELWYDSMYVVDPFKGDCGNKESLWLNEPTYDSTSGHFESGIDLRSNIDINILRERSFQNTQPYVILPSSDSSLYFWSHLYGLRKGKNLLLEWKEPNNQLWFKYDTKLDKDYWYYYYWSYITHENLKEGPWNVQLSYNGSLISRVEFNVSEKANLVTTKPLDLCTRAKNQSSAQLENSPNVKLNIYNILGHEMDQTQIIPPGLYVYHLTKERQTCTFKRIHR
ncbi:MAG: M23 family metallopeptidase, partial [Bacteroidia bacterium]